jgi:hypothetical protein
MPKESATKNPPKKKHSLGEDLEIIKLSFNLFQPFSIVVEELKEKGFEYKGIHCEEESTFLFKSKKRKEYITVYISKEDNLLIRQFSEADNKLRILYVVKDSERTFKIL